MTAPLLDGKATAAAVRRELNATVTLRHTGTKGLAWHVREADIVVEAAERNANAV